MGWLSSCLRAAVGAEEDTTCLRKSAEPNSVPKGPGAAGIDRFGRLCRESSLFLEVVCPQGQRRPSASCRRCRASSIHRSDTGSPSIAMLWIT